MTTFDFVMWTSDRLALMPPLDDETVRLLTLWSAHQSHTVGRPSTSFLRTHALQLQSAAAYNALRELQLRRDVVDFEQLVVFEDARFIVLNKPFDLRIDTGHAHDCVWSTLSDALRVYRRADDVPQPLKFCHQLDYSTSGIITIAKTRAAAALAAREFETRRTVKYYSAVILGRLAGDCSVDAPIADDPAASNRMLVYRRSQTSEAAAARARSARTTIQVVSHGTLNGKVVTRVRMKPESGRRHQLRLHAALLGHPIVGDVTYGGDECDEFRMMLHAQFLQFAFSPPLTLLTPDPFAALLSDESAALDSLQ
jgi:tRNA pseudouridine32 synthase/23S rRNA pseudouridine746 synthase